MLDMTKMVYPNKEYNVLELFLNEPTKHWHFKGIVKEANISKERANYWLKKFVKEKIISHIKPKGKMPFFIANYEHANYDNRKKLYALNKLYESGLLTELQSLEKAKVVVIFGSFARGDWHTKSDIDVFIYGDPGKFEFGTMAFWREVQVQVCKNKKEIKEIRSGLMKDVIKGMFIKGNITDLAEVSI